MGKGPDWSHPNASEFEFRKSYSGRGSDGAVHFTGHLHDDLSMQGMWQIPALAIGGFFYFQPLAILQAPLSELEGHGPVLLSHRADTHAFVVELSDSMFTELHKEMLFTLNELKKLKSIQK